jgi:uncharacterized protein YqeY
VVSLKEKIQQDLKSALKDNKELEISVLRLLSASILNKEKEKRYKVSKEKPNLSQENLAKESQLSDEEILNVIFAEVKKRNEAIEAFSQGKREEAVAKERRELEILKKYLPDQLSEEKIQELVKEIIKKRGANGLKDMGKVMQELMPKIKGRAEGSVVSKIVKDLLMKQE